MTSAQEVVSGIQMIMMYEPEAQIAAEHDKVFCGSSVSHKLIRPEEMKTMEIWGWTFNEHLDSWESFV